DQRDHQVGEQLAAPPEDLLLRPGAFVQLEPLISRSLEEALDAPVDAFEKHRLRTRPPAPHPAEPRGEEEQREAERGEEEDDHPRVLGVEGLPEEEESTVDDVQVDGRLPVDPDEREGQVDGDEEGIEAPPPPDESSLHVGGMDRLARSIRLDAGETTLVVCQGRGLHAQSSRFSPCGSLPGRFLPLRVRTKAVTSSSLRSPRTLFHAGMPAVATPSAMTA